MDFPTKVFQSNCIGLKICEIFFYSSDLISLSRASRATGNRVTGVNVTENYYHFLNQ